VCCRDVQQLVNILGQHASTTLSVWVPVSAAHGSFIRPYGLSYGAHACMRGVAIVFKKNKNHLVSNVHGKCDSSLEKSSSQHFYGLQFGMGDFSHVCAATLVAVIRTRSTHHSVPLCRFWLLACKCCYQCSLSTSCRACKLGGVKLV
jgi:hypothetical protein